VYYFIGDIHGHFKRLEALFKKLAPRFSGEGGDTVIFLGDYIDRGPHSYEVVDFLIHLSRIDTFRSVFLKGNHEDMFLSFLEGRDQGGSFLMNGGDATIRSYEVHEGRFHVPRRHMEFFRGLLRYYEGEDFIAVHAGLNPTIDTVEEQSEYDCVWIREAFYRAAKRWDKTVIFGHTPVPLIGHAGPVYFDESRNIIGIDSGVIFGRPLVCLTWPDREVIR